MLSCSVNVHFVCVHCLYAPPLIPYSPLLFCTSFLILLPPHSSSSSFFFFVLLLFFLFFLFLFLMAMIIILSFLFLLLIVIVAICVIVVIIIIIINIRILLFLFFFFSSSSFQGVYLPRRVIALCILFVCAAVPGLQWGVLRCGLLSLLVRAENPVLGKA